LYNYSWASPAKSISGPSLAELLTIIYSLIKDSTNLTDKVPVFVSLKNRIVQLYPRALISLFIAYYDTRDLGGGILNSFHTRCTHVVVISLKTAFVIVTDVKLQNLTLFSFMGKLFITVDRGRPCNGITTVTRQWRYLCKGLSLPSAVKYILAAIHGDSELFIQK
jgi:hypothetical protein